VPDVQIRPVATSRELSEFVRFPFRLYRGDPNWVPPLISDRLKHFSPHNPFFEHAQARLFRAIRDGRTVGTIAAIADENHVKTWNEPVGFFGAFETVEDYDVAAALFTAARDWLAAHGRDVMRGPMDLNINDESGLLIDGFDGPPVIMMTYNKTYYRGYLERYGFTKAKDVHAYKVAVAPFGPNLENMPERVTRVARIARERYQVEMRHIDMKHFYDEVARIKPIYRQAWAKNWGAVPMTDAEFAYLAASLKPIVDPELTYVAYLAGQPVGCFLALPDFCQVAMHLNGRLMPFGWINYLRYQRKIDGLRVVIMGVLEEHRLKGIEALFYEEAARVAVRKRFKWAEMSWILEDNYKVIRGIEGMGGVRYRTYRFYDLPTAGR
jgi:GNAT superfamily N-acetyltransferase